MATPIRVQVVYRNYIPLYSSYQSFSSEPPDGVRFLVPPPKTYLRPIYQVYRRFSAQPLVRSMVNRAQGLLFKESTSAQYDCDLFFFVGMIPSKPPRRPYLVDVEHVSALLNFVEQSDIGGARERALAALTHESCRGIVPWSQAAVRTIHEFFGTDYAQIASKVTPLLPALDCLRDRFGQAMDPGRHSPGFRLLYIGREPYRKGLPEILDAYRALKPAIPELALDIVEDLSPELKRRVAGMAGVEVHSPRFSLAELVTRFFMRSHLFVMPTHEDTFGMVCLEALSSGTPVLATKQFAIPEFVRHRQNGFLLDHPPLFLDRPGLPLTRTEKEYALEPDITRSIVEALMSWISHAFHHRGQLFEMGEEAVKDFRSGGRFAVETRNHIVGEIIRNAVGRAQ